MLDYLEWRGDIPFSAMPLNEVDNLIFSTLVYLKMDGLIPPEGITVEELCRRCDQSGAEPSGLVNDPMPLLTAAAASKRFGEVVVMHFVNTVDAELQVQFAAVTYVYAEQQAYVAFRGTDNSIVGWREDFNLSFQSETPGQLQAAEYVTAIAQRFSGELIVGGHSKGGNFAVYGAAFCDPSVRERIVRVYSNDGPGFNRAAASSPEYAAILSKTVKIIPEASTVGILLSSRIRRKVIRSTAKGTMQHDPYSWCVRGAVFEEADERSTSSLFMDSALNNWVSTLSDDELKVFVNTIFEVLEATGADTLKEISDNKFAAYNAIIKAAAGIDPQAMGVFMHSIRKLLASGKDAAVTETKKSLDWRH